MYTVTATRGTELLQSERVATEHGALNIAVVYLHALAADQEYAIDLRPLFLGALSLGESARIGDDITVTIEETA